MQLRPSEWVVVFAWLEELAKPWNWFQSDPDCATVQEVISELIYARTVLEKGPSMYIGEIREFATENPPEGWLRCDGALVLDADYPLLGAVIHPNYREDTDSFYLPNRDRRVGVDGFTVASRGGESQHTMTIGELVPHDHSYDKPDVVLSDVLGELPGFGIGPVPGTTGSTGEGDPFNVRDPYEGTQFYIRASWPTAGG